MFKLPPEDVVALTILGGDNPCLLCGKAIERASVVLCNACDASMKTYGPEWEDYRAQTGNPSWWHNVNNHGSVEPREDQKRAYARHKERVFKATQRKVTK